MPKLRTISTSKSNGESAKIQARREIFLDNLPKKTRDYKGNTSTPMQVIHKEYKGDFRFRKSYGQLF